MKGTELPDPLSYIIKITLVKNYYDRQTVYYRYEVPPQIYGRWKWYFEYIAALVKVRYPRAKVEYYAEQIGVKDPFLAGEYYRKKKERTLLKGKMSQITKIENKMYENDDMFHLKSEEAKSKIERIKEDIQKIKRGEYKFYIPPTYLNNIKKVLKQI